MNRQRHFNRQSQRPPRQNPSSQGEEQTSNRSRGQRGRRRYQSHPAQSSRHTVPSTAQVRPGAHVSIVLKEDQPTGRQVQGTVQDVLTSGEHPRGIKVRLTDGRVGRVQRMSSKDEVEGAQSGRGRAEEGGNGPGYYSERNDAGRSLEAYFPPEWRDGQSGVRDQSQHQVDSTIEEPELSVCPICYEFRGDEAAVTHHANSHFLS
jgi:uncharacterized repeat protein (TIGR03833 family)